MTRPLIVICAGGTGGHMFPALQVAETLTRRGYEVAFLTDPRGRPYIPSSYEIYELPLRGIRLGTVVGILKTLWGGGMSLLYALWIWGKLRPVAALGFGGYPSGPGLLAGWVWRTPLLVHEQNACLGRVNRWLKKIIRVTALSYPLEGKVPPQASGMVLTGIPVRQDMEKVGHLPYEPPSDTEPFHLLIIGGSQGASLLSRIIPGALASLPLELRQRLRVVQQCRPEDLEAVKKIYEEARIQGELASFFSPMSPQFQRAHLVISRAGGSSLGELMATGRPSLLIPFAAAQDDHQTLNGRIISQGKAGWVIPEDQISQEGVADKIAYLMTHPSELRAAAVAARALWIPEAAEKVADLVEGLKS